MRALVIAAVLALVLVAPASAAQVTPAERQAIDRTLDAFVNSAVKRHNPIASYDLVTPDMRSGISRTAWAQGNVPVYPYPAKGSTFHRWTIDSASPRDVNFELQIDSRTSKGDSTVYLGEVKKLGGRWLVDSFTPTATLGGNAVVGPHDFAAPPASNDGGVPSIGSAWIALPAILIVGGIVAALGWLALVWLRNRRAARTYAARPLDAPVTTERRDSERTRDPAQSPR